MHLGDEVGRPDIEEVPDEERKHEHEAPFR
jgi:hypothetical protein